MKYTSIKNHVFPILVLILVCFAVYSNTFQNDFMWDDEKLIVDNHYIKSLGHIPYLYSFKYWKYDHPFKGPGQYRPVRATTFAIDYSLWKLNPAGYHLTNLILHSINVILIYFLIFRLKQEHESDNTEGNRIIFVLMGLPVLTALLFAVHPIHTESVTWVKNRSDLLAFMFYLVAFHLFITHTSQKNIIPFIRTYSAALICFCLAVLSKEMAITLPLILVLYAAVLHPKKEFKKILVKTFPFWCLLIIYIYFRTSGQDMITSVENDPGIGIYTKISIVLKTVYNYTVMLLLPFDLNVERPFTVPESIFEPLVIAGAGLFILILFVLIKTYKHAPYHSFAVLWFFLTLSPASNIIYLSSRPIAEQRLYIPSMGFCLFLALAVKKISSLAYFPRQSAKILSVLAVLILLISYSAITFFRNYEWRDPLSFWSKAAESSPNSARVHYNLGNTYLKQNMLDKAIKNYSAALQIQPNSEETHYNLGLAFASQKKPEEAAVHFIEAFKIKPDFIEAHNNYGIIMAGLGETENAIRHFEKALIINPYNANANYNLGVALDEQGKLEEAILKYNKALNIKPDFAEAHNRTGIAYAKQGKADKAISHFSDALLIMPDFADPRCNMGKVLARQKKYDQAVKYFSEALQIKPDYLDAHYHLGKTFAYQEKFDLAVKHFSEAIRINPDFAEAHNNLGYSLARQKKYKAAAAHFSEAIRIKPDYVEAKKNLEMCRRVLE